MSNNQIKLDVRVISPAEKHPTIFRTFDSLNVGESFQLINDHEPRPLFYQFQAERKDEFEWDYEEKGPEVWKVNIKKIAEHKESGYTFEEEKTASNEFDEDKIIEFDVRGIINSGRDPFTDIMAKVNSLNNDEVLLIINSFEPVPLYAVLGNKGFAHKTVSEGGVFKIYFYKEEEKGEKKEGIVPDNDLGITGEEDVIEMDVRGLEPPEPMVKILEALPNLEKNTILAVEHHREPVMLYPKLEERGFKAISHKIDENHYKVLIFHDKEGLKNE